MNPLAKASAESAPSDANFPFAKVSAESAPEMLSVGPAIRKWLEDVIKPQNICPAQVASLLLCIAVMDLL